MSVVAVRREARRGHLPCSLLVAVALAAALAGCSHIEGDDVVEEDRSITVQIDATADRPLDQMTMLVGESALASGVLTPAMIAAGTPLPANAVAYAGHRFTNELDQKIPQAARSTRFVIPAPPSILPTMLPESVLVIGHVRDSIGNLVPAAAGMLRRDQIVLDPGGKIARGTLAIQADVVARLELWGASRRVCARIDAATPTYFLDATDFDCDGFDNTGDCNPTAFCDPAATSAAAQAACIVSACGPCQLDGASCMLGTRATCRNAAGQPLTYTCDTGGSCGGDAVCLPADACQLGCRKPGASTDPTACILGEWADGAQSSHAIHCQLPTTRTQFGGQVTCAGGAAAEIPLPYTGCASPRIVFDDVVPPAVVALTAPCTLRITAGGNVSVARASSIVVALDTSTGSASLRFTLDPTDGNCSVGACEAVQAAATCEQ